MFPTSVLYGLLGAMLDIHILTWAFSMAAAANLCVLPKQASLGFRFVCVEQRTRKISTLTYLYRLLLYGARMASTTHWCVYDTVTGIRVLVSCDAQLQGHLWSARQGLRKSILRSHNRVEERWPTVRTVYGTT